MDFDGLSGFFLDGEISYLLAILIVIIDIVAYRETRCCYKEKKKITAWFEIWLKFSGLFQQQFGGRCQVPNRKTIFVVDLKFQANESVEDKKRSNNHPTT